MSNLIERLRTKAKTYPNEGFGWEKDALEHEAADEISALHARVATLEEALKRIAAVDRGDTFGYPTVNTADYQEIARKALELKP